MLNTTEEKKSSPAHLNSAFSTPIFNRGLNFDNNYGIGILVFEEPKPDMAAIKIMGVTWNTVGVHVYYDPDSLSNEDNKRTLAIMKAMNYTPTKEELEDDPLFRNVTPDFLAEIITFVKSLDKNQI